MTKKATKKTAQQRRLGTQKWAEILSLAIAGAKIAELSRRYHITRAAIYSRMQQYDLKTKGNATTPQILPRCYRSVPLSDTVLNEIQELTSKGENVAPHGLTSAEKSPEARKAEKIERARRSQALIASKLRVRIRQTLECPDHGAGAAGNRAAALSALTRSLKTLQDVEDRALGIARENDENQKSEFLSDEKRSPVIIVPISVGGDAGLELLERYKAGEVISCETIPTTKGKGES